MGLRRATTHAIAWSVGFWTGVALEVAYNYVLHAPIRHGRLHR